MMMKTVMTMLLVLSFSWSLSAQEAAPKRTFEIADGSLVMPAPVVFQTGTDQLTPEGEAALEHVKAYLEAKSYVTLLRIEGHLAPVDGTDINDLSRKRSLAAARWLVKNGVDCKRLMPVGFGETKPITTNQTAEGRSLNTRMTFVNAELMGKAIGGMPVDGGGMVAGDPCKP